MTLAIIAAANFCFVFLKAIQQRNVAFGPFWLIVPTSLAMTAAEVYVVVAIVQRGAFALDLVLSVGLGAGFGALSAAVLHKRIFHGRSY